MKITLSKSQWEQIGNKTGWIKKAQTNAPNHNELVSTVGVLDKKGGKYSEIISNILYKNDVEHIADLDDNTLFYLIDRLAIKT